MKISIFIYKQIMNCFPSAPPEQGGILGEQDGIVCEYFHDAGLQVNSSAVYIPNIALLNKQIQCWSQKGIRFCGIIHSHLPNQTTLSEQDIQYIRSVINVAPKSIAKLYFPIIIPKHKIFSYSVCTDRPNPIIRPDRIIIYTPRRSMTMLNQELLLKRERAAKLKRLLSIADHAIALKTDGTVITCGSNEDRQRNLENIENAIAVSCAGYHSVVLVSNGKVGAYGAFLADDDRIATSDWSHMIDITCGPCDTVGITQDGHVRSCGAGIYPHTARWSGITMIAIGFTFMLGLKDDGTVLSCESNEAIYYNQSKNIKIDTCNWDHMIDISCGREHAVGLKSDGTVVVCGKNDYGQCEVASWNNIISVSCGSYHTLGLRADGTVVACGKNENGQCNVSNWKNVVGLAGCMWRNSSAATCADGTVLICGDTLGTAEAATWKLFNNIDTYEDECRVAREEHTRLLRCQNGLCVHCGGRFKGIFRKQCSVCGKTKDY